MVGTGGSSLGVGGMGGAVGGHGVQGKETDFEQCTKSNIPLCDSDRSTVLFHAAVLDGVRTSLKWKTILKSGTYGVPFFVSRY